MQLFESVYRAGSLVFGGRHVVLPLLQAKVVPNGWVDNSLFLTGYGAAQALPGSLFTFAAFLGAVSTNTPNGWLGASIAIVAIFCLRFIDYRGLTFMGKSASTSFHAESNTGNKRILLLTAFYQPVWTSAIYSFPEKYKSN